MRTTWTLTKMRMRLALRNRAFLFFSLLMPIAFLFLYASLFAKGEPRVVGYLFPSVLALTVMGSFWGLSIQLVLFREHGILRRFRLTPAGPGALLASSLLSNYILTLPTVVLEFVLVRTVYGVTMFGNLWGVGLFLTLGIVTFAAFGLIVASLTSTIQETQVLNNAIWFLFLFFSGATLPLVFFPEWLQRLSMFLPATHLVVGLQFTLIGALPVRLLGTEVIALVGGGGLAFVLSWKLFRWEPEEKISRSAKAWAAAVAIPFLLLGVWENAVNVRRTELQEIYKSVGERASPLPNPH
ncbi:MAG: ABC transporter permease [Firmicutes bacterium]|nr:ABC transporter permease [Bacillota bacterium]